VADEEPEEGGETAGRGGGWGGRIGKVRRILYFGKKELYRGV